MAILRRKCISLFREYQILPNQKQKGSRESKLTKILFSQYVSAEISYTIYILIFRYDWQGHRKQIREIKCASCLHKTKCYSQGRDRLRLKLASSPQVKELLGEIVINCSPRHFLFVNVKYCIFRYLSYIVSHLYSFLCYFGLAVKMHPANEILLIISHCEYDCTAAGLRKVKLSWSRSTCPAYNEM